MTTMLAILALAVAAEPVTADLEGHAYDPVWSPDGRQLVVNVSRHDEEASLWVVPVLAGEQPVRIELPGASNPFSGASPVAMNPVWRRPGAFLFEGTDPAGRFRLYEAREGRVSEVRTARAGHLTFPSLAGDGALAFVADDTGQGDIYLLAADGTERRLTESDVPEMFPQLSADGRTVVYSRKVLATEDLFERDLATGIERPLAGGAGDQTRPTRAGDVVLFFDGSRGPGVWDLVAVGSGSRRVLARDVALPVRARPAVSPDGRWVAFARSDVQGPDAQGGIVVAAVDGSARAHIPTDRIGVGEPALGVRDGRLWLAYTGLPDGDASWREVYVEDIHDAVTGAQNSRQDTSLR